MKIQYLILILLFGLIACQEEAKKSEVIVLSTNEVKINGSTENGVSFSASIKLDNDDVIVEQGFVYGLKSNPGIGNDLIITLSESGLNKFSVQVEDALIPDTTYFVRSYIKTGYHLIYGNEVEFYSNGSEPPALNNIEPQLAFWNDTIKITGDNFDFTGKANKVFFDEFEANRTWGSGDTIYAVVPEDLDRVNSEITVELYGQHSSNSKAFEIYSPVINFVSQSEGQYPDTVVIEGDYFNPKQAFVNINGQKCEMVSSGLNHFSFIVPFLKTGGNYELQLHQAGKTTVVNNSFKYNEQEIYGIVEGEVYFSEPMMITAKNVDFRRIPVTVYLGSTPMYTNYYQKKQDTLIFRLSNPWYELKKQNDYRVSLGYGKEDLFAGIFYFKNPLFELVETETVINGSLKANRRGFSVNGKCYLSGPVTDSFYPSTYSRDEFIWNLRYELLPGTYTFYYKDDLGRSEDGEFVIKQPVLKSLSQGVYSRDDRLITINGDNLPLNMWSGNSYFKIRDLNSNRVYDFYGKSNNIDLNELYALWLVGRGEYEIYLELRGEKISNSLQFSFEDDWVYVDSIQNLIQPRFWNKKGLVWDDKLIVTDGYGGSFHNFTTSETTEVDQIDNGVKNLFYFKGDIYAHQSYGPLYKLNTMETGWDAVVNNLNGEYIDVVYTHDSSIYLVSQSGQVYILEDGVVAKQGALQGDYHATSYVHSSGDELFFFRQIEIEVIDPATYASKEKVNIGIDKLRRNEKNFVPFKDGLAVYHNDVMAFFNSETKELSNVGIKRLPGYYDSIIYSNENGDLFILNENHIYNYKPQ